jgi:hypothetical protein
VDTQQQTQAAIGARVRKARLRFVLWVALMPSTTFAISFSVLCAIECTALPWTTFMITPFASLALGLLGAVLYWNFASSLPEESRGAERKFVGTSILWGPFLAGLVFVVGLMLLQPLVVAGGMVARSLGFGPALE